MSDTVEDLVNYAVTGQATKFTSAFEDLIGQRAAERVDAYRIHVAQSMYADEEDFEEDLEDELEDDVLDDELEDLDVDLDDEDLNSEVDELLNAEDEDEVA